MSLDFVSPLAPVLIGTQFYRMCIKTCKSGNYYYCYYYSFILFLLLLFCMVFSFRVFFGTSLCCICVVLLAL